MKHIWIAIVIAIAVLATACQSSVPPVPYTAQAAKPPADVIIVGSSAAGFAAAIASARQGADTVLVTESACVGGQASCAGVSTWDGTGAGLDNWFRLTLTQEYKDANVRLGGCYAAVAGVGPDTYVDGDNFCPHPDRVESEMLSWLNYYGVTLVGPVDAYRIGTDGSVYTSAGVMHGQVVVEATETGELIPVSLRHRVDPACKQQSTWVASVRQPGAGGLKIKDLQYPTDPAYMAHLADWWTSTQYHWAGLSGEIGFSVYRRTHDLNGEVEIYLNWMNDDSSVAVSHYKTMQMLVFLGQHGYGEWRYEVRPIPYTRTSDYRLNGVSYLGATPRGVDSFADSAIVARYRTDNHGASCAAITGAVQEPYGDYDVPLGIGIPAARVPILVAMPRSGNISDIRATSLRMQPDELGFGEAIGVLAGLSVQTNRLPQDVPVADVRSVLVGAGGRVDVG